MACLSTKFQRNIDLTNAKTFVAMILLSHAAKSLVSGVGEGQGGRARGGPGAWQAPIRSSGKSLAQGQVALIDPI